MVNRTMTATSGNSFRVHVGGATVPPTREIHEAHPSSYRVPPGRFPCKDDSRKLLRLRAGCVPPLRLRLKRPGWRLWQWCAAKVVVMRWTAAPFVVPLVVPRVGEANAVASRSILIWTFNTYWGARTRKLRNWASIPEVVPQQQATLHSLWRRKPWRQSVVKSSDTSWSASPNQLLIFMSIFLRLASSMCPLQRINFKLAIRYLRLQYKTVSLELTMY